MRRVTRAGAVLLGLFVALFAANVALWGFGRADHFSRKTQTKLFILDAFCLGTYAMFLSGRTPFALWGYRSGRLAPRSEAETLEKWTE
ncbi:MAG: hypothetical protein QOD07_1762 [Frankiaceae bacterium]|jgi:hypothetical protein|nr:hypothetical protein [Frankiaceae bacterium]